MARTVGQIIPRGTADCSSGLPPSLYNEQQHGRRDAGELRISLGIWFGTNCRFHGFNNLHTDLGQFESTTGSPVIEVVSNRPETPKLGQPPQNTSMIAIRAGPPVMSHSAAWRGPRYCCFPLARLTLPPANTTILDRRLASSPEKFV